MGQDKALLPFGKHKTLIEYQLDKFGGYFNQIYLSAKSKKLDIDANWILEDSEISAPIVAIIEILKRVKTERVFVVAVDMPFFGVDEAKKLLAIDADIVLAKTASGLHPLAGAYSKKELDLIENSFNSGEYKLQKIINKVDYKTVEFEERYLSNLNYIEEYKEAYENSGNK